MSKKLLILLTFIFLTTSLGVFVVAGKVFAGSECKTGCPCSVKNGQAVYQCPPKDGDKSSNIRMQIPIPGGVTNSCTYYVDEIVGGKIQKDIPKTCHYIDSNLPFYVKRLYSFAIGAVAILAVLMIMIGGFQWVMAAGSSSAIGAARSKIIAAVSGLILALLSWVILNTINPSLTNLEFTKPSGVTGIEQGSEWCATQPKGTKLILEKPEKEKTEITMDPGVTSFKCGDKYNIVGTKSRETGTQQCMGNSCGEEIKINSATGQAELIGKSDTICGFYSDIGTAYCIDPKKQCEEQDKNSCEVIDKIIQQYDDLLKELYGSSVKFKESGCHKRIDDKNPDQCVYGDLLSCESGWERVPMGSSKKCYDSTKEEGKRYCDYNIKWFESWTISHRALLYATDGRAVKGVDAICCKKKGEDEFKCETEYTAF